jgi:transaldolase
MGGELNPAQRLHALGQSLWLDSINRVMLRTGALAQYVRDLAVTGLTSNPTILGHAMAAGSDYDASLARLASGGVSDAQDLVYALALEDLAEAAALFRPEWDQSGGAYGYVSLEVPPDLAYDAAATVALARRLHGQAGFPNLLVKIPGTPQGLTAMEEAITAGIGVNVTLLFSDSHYLRTADAYLRALERRRLAGLNLAVPSVASVFISHWDAAADPLLPPALHGSLGLAMAQKTYASHLSLLAEERWQALAAAGARSQRVLWASTSTKKPDLPDTYYLGRLAAPDTIDTVPEKTLLASPTTETPTSGSSPTTPPRNGPSPRPPTPASTPTRSPSICSAREQAPSPRTGPRCSPRSRKRQQNSRPKAAAKSDPAR